MIGLGGELEKVLRAIVRDELRAARAEEREAATAAGVAGDLLTVAEYARRRSISVSTVRKAIRAGSLRATRVGKRMWRVAADAEIVAGVEAAVTSTAARADRILGALRSAVASPSPATIPITRARARRAAGGDK